MHRFQVRTPICHIVPVSRAYGGGGEGSRSGIVFGPYPQYGWDFPEEIPEKFRKDPGNALRAFPGISLESTAGMPQTL